jgi:excisionase family DNA binding protein
MQTENSTTAPETGESMSAKTGAYKYHRTRPNTKKPSAERATLTPHESMKITGIGVQGTYKLLHAGEIPSIKVGNRYFIPRAALLKWLENAGNRPLTAA